MSPSGRGQDLPDPFMASRDAFSGHPPAMARRDAPLARSAPHPLQRLLLFGIRDQFTARADTPAERWLAAQILAASLLRPLGGADAVPLELGNGTDDGQEQPGDAVAADVVGAAVQVQQ